MVRKKYEQQVIEPANAIEENFLKTSRIYAGQQPGVYIEDMRAESAMNNLRELQVQELIWPKKQIKTTRSVLHPLPGSQNMQSDDVTRIITVDMTVKEAAAHWMQQARDLLIAAGEPLPGEDEEKKASKPRSRSTKKEGDIK